MMANRDIVSEAVEQAEAMKAAAYENAKNVLVEAMSTNLQAAVAEAIDEKLDTEDVEISEEVVAEETVEEGAHDTDEMEDKDEMGHMPEMEDEDDDDDDDEEVDIDIDIDADGEDDDEEELDEVDLDEVIEIVEDEDADAVALSLLNGAHGTLFPRVVKELKKKKINDVLVVGGGVIPEEDKKVLEKSGVTGNFGPGTSLDIIINNITKGVSKLRKL